jgi:hypothetical protein
MSTLSRITAKPFAVAAVLSAALLCSPVYAEEARILLPYDQIAAELAQQRILPEANTDGLYVRGAIAADVPEGVEGLDEAMTQFPKTVAVMMKSVGKHGIAAFAYDDPAVKAETDSLARSLGKGIGGIVRAVARDMTDAARGNRL